MSQTKSQEIVKLSVIVASKVGPPFIDDCLASLETESKTLDAEVIVVACGTVDYARRIRQKFPWVRVIHHPGRAGVPALRHYGVEQASGDVVAIIEEHCLAANDWLQKALGAHRCGNYGAVGGPVVDSTYKRLRDWVVYFCEYNSSLPPAPDGEVFNLNGANIAYRRQVLIDHQHLLGDGYWEASLHPTLLAEGVKFVSVPDMVVHHRGPFDFGYYLQQRYWFSRAFAGARAKTLPTSRRLAYVVAAPLVPAILLARMAWQVWRKRCHVGKFVRSFPLLIPALTVFVAGEWIGYLIGPGHALSKVE
jgi:glycosyltransferase involved in cell wall biosynthesis